LLLLLLLLAASRCCRRIFAGAKINFGNTLAEEDMAVEVEVAAEGFHGDRPPIIVDIIY
jgi:hypothetical protein